MRLSAEETDVTALAEGIRELLSLRDYKDAEKYLLLATEWDLWPRTTAAYSLGRLQCSVREWDKAQSVIDMLQDRYSVHGGTELANRLTREIASGRQTADASNAGTGPAK